MKIRKDFADGLVFSIENAVFPIKNIINFKQACWCPHCGTSEDRRYLARDSGYGILIILCLICDKSWIEEYNHDSGILLRDV